MPTLKIGKYALFCGLIPIFVKRMDTPVQKMDKITKLGLTHFTKEKVLNLPEKWYNVPEQFPKGSTVMPTTNPHITQSLQSDGAPIQDVSPDNTVIFRGDGEPKTPSTIKAVFYIEAWFAPLSFLTNLRNLIKLKECFRMQPKSSL